MLVNGFATALLWELSLMLRASHAVGTFVDTLRTWGLQLAWGFASCAVFCASRGFDVNDRQLAVNGRKCFLACFARYGRQCFLCGVWCAMVVNGFATA